MRATLVSTGTWHYQRRIELDRVTSCRMVVVWRFALAAVSLDFARSSRGVIVHTGRLDEEHLLDPAPARRAADQLDRLRHGHGVAIQVQPAGIWLGRVGGPYGDKLPACTTAERL